MKERLIYLIYTILVIIGFAFVFGIIKMFLPSWVYWSSLFLALAGVFWEITKPEKKRYWNFTFMEFKDGHQRIGYGVQKEKEEFDFAGFYKEHPTYNIIFIKEISKKQYEELEELMRQGTKTDEGGIGAIIGSVVIADCVQNHPSVWAEKGVWNWVLKDEILFDKPIRDVKGKLGFWEYDLKD